MKKGQKVYQACESFSSDLKNKIRTMLVVERTLSSCGKKEATFEDFGYDSVYGRSVWADYITGTFHNIFETKEEAYTFLEKRINIYKDSGGYQGYTFNIIRNDFTDRDNKPFEVVEQLKHS